jgi:N-acetylglucosaminyl-diphospho-decaprenol L-rhamnosyltransferase
MILSVVIVNFNVKFFLEQCLSSLKKAIEGSSLTNGQTEVYIVDNASSDGSVDFLIPLFPSFHFIRNNQNTGFAKANNQALSRCSGDYILFLNPDTIVSEDSLEICLNFFRSVQDVGALGIRMIDGAGKYLRESKRGFPAPRASFFKMTGLTRLFPDSKIFSAYYMGHLDERTSHPVDVLSGAFMMIRKTVLDITGGFDEQFFMYAEDIDLSFRIRQAGFQNYYLSKTTIIHFKGESTKKDVNHVNIFYGAMDLFMKKHFKGSRSGIQMFLLHLGVRMHRALYNLRYLIKKSTGKSDTPRMVFVNGDLEDKVFWNYRLAKLNIPTSDSQSNAQQIIYCEGPRHPWKSIIAEISNNKNRYLYKFYGSGTHAAVGSNSNQSRGEVFEI